MVIKKGEIGINTLIYVFLGIVVLAIIVMLIISWKDKALELVMGVFNVEQPFKK